MYRIKQLMSLLSEKAATGWSESVDVSDYRQVQVVISTSNSTNCTIKIAGSFLNKENVVFTSSPAVGNEWDYVYSYNYQTASGSTGDTGIVYTGTDAVEQLIVNTEGLATLAVHIPTYSAGKVTVKVLGVTNQ